jgi:outer membrane lipoprotein-sorting protein
MSFKSILLAAFCLLLTAYSYAQYPGYKSVSDETTFRKRAQEYTKKTNSLESDFKQIKHLSMLTENSVSKGKFWFKKDNLLRWEYKEPVLYLIVLNNGKAYIKDNGKVKKFDMNSNRIFKQVNDLMLSAVKGDILESTDYKITYFEGTDSFLAELLPLQKNMKEYVKNILIYFDKKDFSVSKFRMTELSGDYTEVEFSNKKTNVSLESSIFTGN